MFAKIKDLFGNKNRGLGVEICSERINIVQIQKKGPQYKLATNISVEIPEGIFEEGHIIDQNALAELLQETLESNNLKVKKVATSVPMKEAIMKLIPIPADIDDQELKDVVLNHEAALYLPFPREEVDLDYQKINYFMDEDGIEKVNVLLVATKRETTDLYRSTFLQAGLDVNILEISSFALIRTIREQLRQFNNTEAVVLVDIEFDSTEIAIILEGVPQFSRTVPIGTFQLQNALSRAMNLPSSRSMEVLQGLTIPNLPPQQGTTTGATSINPGMSALMRVLGELADELRRSIDFYLNQSGDLDVAQLLLAGPGGGIGQLDEFFTKRLSYPAMPIDPINSLALEIDQDIPLVERPGLATVIGLGMREV